MNEHKKTGVAFWATVVVLVVVVGYPLSFGPAVFRHSRKCRLSQILLASLSPAGAACRRWADVV